jgi:OOP family OmpA-OmpF porin
MQSTKHLGMAVATIAGLVAALPSPAQQRAMPSAPGFYFGAGAGVGYANYNNNDFDNIANGLNGAGIGGGGLTQNMTSRETTDFGWKLFGGYRFNQYIGVEGGYTGFSRMDIQYQFNQNGAPAGNGSMSYNVYSWNVSVVPRLPLHQAGGLYLQGKLGAAFTTVENTFNLNAGAYSQQGTNEKSRTNVLAGVGLGYDFANGLSIIGEYEYYGRVGDSFSYGSGGLGGTGRADMNLFSVSGMIRF